MCVQDRVRVQRSGCACERGGRAGGSRARRVGAGLGVRVCWGEFGGVRVPGAPRCRHTAELPAGGARPGAARLLHGECRRTAPRDREQPRNRG